MGTSLLTSEQLNSIRLVAFDFDGVFTDNTVYISEDGVESVRCWRSDGLGLSLLKSIGLELLIISTEKNPVVTARSKKLEVNCIQGVKDKASTILEVCKELNIDPMQCMFVGNDINDISAFKVVGYPVSVADAYHEVHQYVLFCTESLGGRGAVREICDLIYKASNLNQSRYVNHAR
jgi:3-deoxy-D-manno-octulosonate 8-phosphate phosphatase (KDO 8-P phosphatase)